MNKDKRNFLDEEKEIEKLLSEFESENIKIPDELDERLNEHKYIIPGLGDAGDRIFGTK